MSDDLETTDQMTESTGAESLTASAPDGGAEHERALEAIQSEFGAASMEAAAALVRIGAAHHCAGRLSEAHRAYVRALEITEETLGSEHVELARIFCNLAELELSRGRFSTGEPYARRSLEICRRAPGVPEAQVAGSMQVLAALLAGQGRSSECDVLHHAGPPASMPAGNLSESCSDDAAIRQCPEK